MTRRVACLLALAVLPVFGCVWLTGCAGYRVGPVLTADYKSVAVPMFRNSTLVPQLEAQVTNAIIKRLQADGALQVHAEENADIIVAGRITDYRRLALRSLRLDTGVTREYRIRITAELEVRDRRTGRPVFKTRTVSGSAETFIGQDQQTAEFQVLPLVADDLARQVVAILTESW
jgi:hypothetical protein